jgi:lipopolysaccharide transport system ATP-binding protein
MAVGVVCHAPIVRPTVGILLKDRLGNDVFGTNTYHLGGSPETLPLDVPHEFRFSLPVNLGVGHYSLTVAVHAGETHVQGNYDWWEHAHTLQVVPGPQPSFIGTAYLPVEVSVGRVTPIAPESAESHA